MRKDAKKEPVQRTSSRTAIFYSFILIVTFLIGLGPVVFNLIIDPYEMHKLVNMGLAKEKIGEKSHYPLWKVTHFPEETSDVVILGDSRARAMKNKYWHELGLSNAYNFAYGGTTMLEIYDTFQFVKNSRNLKALVVGIQLRSFDPDHKGRMNRVPEAVRLNDNPLQYYSNWFVSGIGIKILNKEYGAKYQWLADLKPSLVTSAYAGDAPKNGHRELGDLLEPVVCASCILPEDVPAQQHPSLTHIDDYYFAAGLGIWRPLWSPILVERVLPQKFEKQIVNNAKSDWRSFDFSEDFWSYLVEMSNWCRQHHIKLIFVIPPTIVEMQNRLVEFGHGTLNHRFRERLTGLGLVVDFDFDNQITRDLDRFKDAYHFNSETSRMIVGEITQLVSDDEKTVARAQKRRKDIICPLSEQDVSIRIFDDVTEVLEGKSCRIWRVPDD